MDRTIFGENEPYHDTATTYIGTTPDADRALEMSVSNVCLMRINQDKWPKELRAIKKQVRFVLKEAGHRNFLAVVNV